jgi:hypothetical protein
MKILAPNRLTLCVYLGIVISSLAMLLVAVRSDTYWRDDFTAFYTGWTVAISQDHSELYNLDTQRRYQSSILSRDGHEINELQSGLLPYLNPPHITALFAPLARLSRRQAFNLWTAFGFVLLFLLWRSVSRLGSDWTTEERLFAFGAIAVTPLTIIILGAGALSLLVTVAIFRAYLAVRDGRDFHAAAWLALATVKPQMVLFPLVAFLIIRRWRLLVPFALITAALSVSSIAIIGFHPFLKYPALLTAIAVAHGEMSVLTTTTTTLRGVLFTLFGYGATPMVNRVSTVVMLGALLFIIDLWRRPSENAETKMALTILAGLFFGLHVNPVDDLLICLPAMLLYSTFRNSGMGFYLSRCLLAFPVLIFAEWRLTTLRPFGLTLHLLMIGLLLLSIAPLLPSKPTGELPDYTS